MLTSVSSRLIITAMAASLLVTSLSPGRTMGPVSGDWDDSHGTETRTGKETVQTFDTSEYIMKDNISSDLRSGVWDQLTS